MNDKVINNKKINHRSVPVGYLAKWMTGMPSEHINRNGIGVIFHKEGLGSKLDFIFVFHKAKLDGHSPFMMICVFGQNR